MTNDDELVGFANPDCWNNDDDDDDNEDDHDAISKATPKSKKSNKSGGFQNMGLSPLVIKGILKFGYRIPTPIQRKVIPPALEGRDVVGMARTGSGKTAAFLIPLFEKLKERRSKTGARALIISPTIELARQTNKFIKILGKFTGLKSVLILGGDSMDNQFSAIHENPDIIVAVPGRFLHICVEMDLKLDSIEFVVFDEADRMFEMGSGYNIQEIISRLPETRQTLLISATLPKMLTEFISVGLSNPFPAFLDLELPENLALSFITCRHEEKMAVLFCLLRYVIKPDALTVVFVASNHHVEYMRMLLDKANIPNAIVHGHLDASARKINMDKFKFKKARVLVTTDLSARGIDVPLLDYVINFHFPSSKKLFVHRAGRCARAGRSGTAYSLVSTDEFPYVLDLEPFLGIKLKVVSPSDTEESLEGTIPFGKLPQTMIENELSELLRWNFDSHDLQNQENVCKNSYDKVIRSRPGASGASLKKSKTLNLSNAGVIPEFRDKTESGTVDILLQMKKYRPPGTVFEIGAKSSNTAYQIMKTKRALHKDSIIKYNQKDNEQNNEEEEKNNVVKNVSKLPESSADDIKAVFGDLKEKKKRKIDDLYRMTKKPKREKVKDDEFYIPYSASDKDTQAGLAVNNFKSAASRAEMDLTGDSEETRRLQTNMKKWDRKKKKMITINNTSKVGKIRTESGAWIPASYKTNRYSQWKEKAKIRDANDDSDDEPPAAQQKLKTTVNTHWGRHNQKLKEKVRTKQELKRPEQILKQRKLAEKKQARSGKKGKSKKSKKSGKK